MRLPILIICFFVFSAMTAQSAEQKTQTPTKSEAESHEPLPSTIRVLFDADSVEGRGLSLDGTYYFSNNFNFSLGTSRSHLKGDTDQATNSEFSFGLGTDPEQRLSGSLQFLYWGLQDALTANSATLPINIKFRNWKFNLTPGSGSITMTGPRREYLINEKSIGASVSYRGLSRWEFTVAGESHSYTEDLYALAQTRILGVPIFSFPSVANTADLASNLINNRSALEILYHFKKFDLSGEWSQSESALDLTKNNSTTLSVDYFLNNAWTLIGTIGRSASNVETDPLTGEDLEPVGFMYLGFEYAFTEP